MRQETTREVADQLQLLVDAIADYAIFLLDPRGYVATWNEGARRIKGYEADEIVGQHFSRFYTEPDLARDHPAHELEIAARDGRYEEEGWRLRKDGSTFWATVVITALRDETGELVGFGKVTRDLSERRAAEERLQELRRAISTIQDYAIFLLDRSGHVATWNEGARRIKGYEAEEIIGRHFSSFYTEPDLARDHPSHELEIAAREGRFEEEGWRVRKDGSTFWANVVITALRDEAGELTGFAKVTRDLTERRRAETELRETADELERSNRELERFASAAAHDLVEPLHTIVGLADLVRLRQGDALGETGVEALLNVRKAGEALRERVDGLLAYARASRGGVAAVRASVDHAVERVVGTLDGTIQERGAVVERQEGLGYVLAEPALLELVLQNLVANALKFSDGPPHIAIGADTDGDQRRLWVADDGIGIAPEHREKVFGLFSRLHNRERFAGNGMGLALCRQIVERHGGRIGVDSTPGGGSTFWVTLPAADG